MARACPAVAVLACSVLTGTPAEAVPDAAAADSLVASTAAPPPIVHKLNRVRRRHGLRRLSYSASLASSSLRFARHLMRADRFGHAPRIRANPRYRWVGEVLALHRGWSGRTSRTMRDWMHSPIHRHILLSRSFSRVGAGRAAGYFRGRRATIWVMQVGKRR
jgi:uncharacterized protein YkwD